jgi:glycosyltransferase involved in cell wall biosynthesis
MGPDVQKQLTIILPAFNEEHAIVEVMRQVQTNCSDIVREILVVDDGSGDQTARVAEAAGARVIRHHQNMGYGAAIKTGIRSAQTEWILIMDADGQHRMEDVLQLSKLIDKCDMAVGHRTGLVHSTLWRLPGKWLLGLMANYLTRQTIPDLNSGLRLIRKTLALKYLHICPSGFSFSTTITLAFHNRKYDVLYVPIQVEKRYSGKSMVSIGTGLDTFILILRIASLFDPLRIFVPLSVLTGLFGICLGIYYIIMAFTISGAPILLIVSSLILFTLGLLCDQISQLRLERFE